MKQEPRQLLTDDFIKIAYDSFGGDIKAWPDSLKDQAAKMAQRNGNRDQLNSIMLDFWANQSLLPLYDYKVEEVLNNVYAFLEDFMQIDVDDWVQANVTERAYA